MPAVPEAMRSGTAARFAPNGLDHELRLIPPPQILFGSDYPFVSISVTAGLVPRLMA